MMYYQGLDRKEGVDVCRGAAGGPWQRGAHQRGSGCQEPVVMQASPLGLPPGFHVRSRPRLPATYVKKKEISVVVHIDGVRPSSLCPCSHADVTLQ